MTEQEIRERLKVINVSWEQWEAFQKHFKSLVKETDENEDVQSSNEAGER